MSRPLEAEDAAEFERDALNNFSCRRFILLRPMSRYSGRTISRRRRPETRRRQLHRRKSSCLCKVLARSVFEHRRRCAQRRLQRLLLLESERYLIVKGHHT
jgi:hypothetical protein